MRCLIYSSSAAAVTTRKDAFDMEETDDCYPRESDLNEGIYGITKQRAEKIVLRSNSDRLTTIALRFTTVYGEGDSRMIRVIESSTLFGRFMMRISNVHNVLQFTYVGNVAWAHLCAMRALLRGGDTSGGKGFFITDDTPPLSVEFFEPIITRLGYQYLPFGIPLRVVIFLAVLVEFFVWILSPLVSLRTSPSFKRSMIDTGFVNSHTFCRKRAETLLQYQPLFSYEESKERTLASIERTLNYGFLSQ